MDPRESAERIYNLLFYVIQSNMPRYDGFTNHPYATGNLMAQMQMQSGANDTGYEIVIGGNSADYGRFAMGYREDGSKRSPRTGLEARNFAVIDNAIRNVSMITASADFGGVYLDGNKIY